MDGGNAALVARRASAIARGISVATPVFAARAENAEIWDAEGRRYIDFSGGIGVLNTGHRHPKVMAAVREQCERLTHSAFQVMAYEPYVALAERLNELAPIKGPGKTAFFTTGAEAVENAVKIARAATGRTGVIAFSGGFHGRTFLGMALTGKVLPYKQQFGPLAPQVYHLPFPIPHYGVEVDHSVQALENLFRTSIAPEQVAAIIIEPVQGEGGFHEAPKSLLNRLRYICDVHGIILIADEIQSGFARTGRMFALQHAGVEADLVTMAKSLGGGFPISAVVGRSDLMDKAEPGGLGGTFAGSPIACAAGLAVLEVIADEDLCGRAVAIGSTLKRRLQGFSQRNDLRPIAHIRGPGAMVAFDAVAERGSSTPDPAAAKAICARACALGLVLLSCGIYGETIRFLTPLTASDDLIDEGLDLLSAALVQS